VIESHGNPSRYSVVGTGLLERFTRFCDAEATVRARCDVKLWPMDVTDESWFVEQKRFVRG
jgi:hypothetical protein